MPDEKQDGRSLKERLEWELLKRGLAQAADGALDAVERSLFGRVGGAEDAVAATKGLTAESALERVRSMYGLEGEKGEGKAGEKVEGKAEGKAVVVEEDPVERAKAQLAELKRAMKKGEGK